MSICFSSIFGCLSYFKRFRLINYNIAISVDFILATTSKYNNGAGPPVPKPKRRFDGSIAETTIPTLKKVIDTAYGYCNFKYFRVRIMFLLAYKKER